MSGSGGKEEIRNWFKLRCRDPRRRMDARRLNIKRQRWEPWVVSHPELHFPFTEDGAWDFIADCLEEGDSFRDLPRSDEFPDYAIYLLHMPAAGGRRIYMKIAARPKVDMVIGVSFHYEREEYLS